MNSSKRQPGRSSPEQERELALLERAIGIAVRAHRGQRDRYESPYILHPLRVMGRVETAAEKTVAVLHDVAEDTKWTLEDLKGEGFPEEILVALDCLTKRAGEPYEELIGRAAGNPLARRVKVADLEDNMDIRRCARVVGPEEKRLARYLAAWETLTGRRGP
ncbi:MAG: GTP pyrophosphokinase [Limisphaerales bacterium]